jgi:multisubunit Na+/H+ antiporter MnhB subunit
MLLVTATIVVVALIAAIAQRKPMQARPERGEGVISVAIAVLIMAIIGVAVLGALKSSADNTNAKITSKINEIN